MRVRGFNPSAVDSSNVMCAGGAARTRTARSWPRGRRGRAATGSASGTRTARTSCSGYASRKCESTNTHLHISTLHIYPIFIGSFLHHECFKTEQATGSWAAYFCGVSNNQIIKSQQWPPWLSHKLIPGSGISLISISNWYHMSSVQSVKTYSICTCETAD